MFIKIGDDGKITNIVETSELTEEQKSLVKKLAEEKASESHTTTTKDGKTQGS